MTMGNGQPPVIRLAAVAYTYRGPPPVRALKPVDLVIQSGPGRIPALDPEQALEGPAEILGDRQPRTLGE